MDNCSSVYGAEENKNFSYDKVDQEITIKENQQMIVMGGIEIEKTLNIIGRLILEE